MRVIRVDDDVHRQRAALEEAAALLRAGKLVAFPTETVYGLGANALDAAAVRGIYEAKGRPAINPLIVHIHDIAAARDLATEWTPLADTLAREFWPGPLTLVVRRRDAIPDIVTAGGTTVGLRMPAHPVALALLEAAQLPIAAPSANLANQVSPTTAQHVASGLADRVDLILDGGPTTVGIESTVVDATGTTPRILRPGMVTRDDLLRVVEAVDTVAEAGHGQAPRSPGMLGKHYSPRARVILLDPDELVAELRRWRESRGGVVGAMTFSPVDADVLVRMPASPVDYARRLYATLHEIDAAGCAVVLVERPPAGPAWAAINDRLERAAR
jgi:L-threonylcarbamoyladenylate synthase